MKGRLLIVCIGFICKSWAIGQPVISVDRFIEERITYLDNNDFNNPFNKLPFQAGWIEGVDMRTETDRFDFNRQRYLLRVSPNSFKKRKVQHNLHEAYLKKAILEKDQLKEDFVEIAYKEVVRRYELEHNLAIQKKILAVLQDQEKVWKKLSLIDNVFPKDWIKIHYWGPPSLYLFKPEPHHSLTKETGALSIIHHSIIRAAGRMEGDEDEDTPTTSKIRTNPTLRTSTDEFKPKNNLTVMSLNARSMNNKFQKIRDAVHSIKPTILCLQETWGKNESTDYSIKGYHKPIFAVRKSHHMNSGGGVAIWVKDCIAFETIKTPFLEKVIETIGIFIPEIHVTIINVYRGFVEYEKGMEKLMNVIDSRNSKGDVLVMGDFNVDMMRDTREKDRLEADMISNGLRQLVTTATRTTDKNKTLIDHIYLKSSKAVKTYLLESDISDHDILLASFEKETIKRKKTTITKRWFQPESYEYIKLFLREEKWDALSQMGPEEGTNYLILKINEILDIFAPVESKDMLTKPINQWKTAGIDISLKHCSKLYRAAKGKPNTNQAMIEYKYYRRVLDGVLKKAKDLYYKEKICLAGNDGRKLWGVVNEVVDRKQCKHTMPNVFEVDGSRITGEKEIANAFNDYFASIGKKMADSLPTVQGFEEYLDLFPGPSLHLEPVDEEVVAKIMKNQKPKLSCGSDTINKIRL